MDAISEYNKKYEFFREITGEAMRVHRKFRGGLLESAYEAALKYLLEQKGYAVERQVFVPMYWDNVRLDQDYRLDLLVNDKIILELKAIKHIDTPHRQQLWSYLRITRKPYGMLINFSPEGLYSEWYHFDELTGDIDRIKLM
jgi:GxxExxY protein